MTSSNRGRTCRTNREGEECFTRTGCDLWEGVMKKVNKVWKSQGISAKNDFEQLYKE